MSNFHRLSFGEKRAAVDAIRQAPQTCVLSQANPPERHLADCLAVPRVNVVTKCAGRSQQHMPSRVKDWNLQMMHDTSLIMAIWQRSGPKQ